MHRPILAAADLFRSPDLWQPGRPFGVELPTRPLTQDRRCAGADQYDYFSLARCRFGAKVIAQIRDIHGHGTAEFAICGNHAARRSFFVIPGDRVT